MSHASSEREVNFADLKVAFKTLGTKGLQSDFSSAVLKIQKHILKFGISAVMESAAGSMSGFWKQTESSNQSLQGLYQPGLDYEKP